MKLPRRFGRILTVLPAAWILLPVNPVSGQESLADLPAFRDGSVALEDGRFSTAVASFRKAWNTAVSAEAGDLEKDFVASRLLRALVQNGETAAAVTWLQENTISTPSPETLLWSALAYQNENQFARAAQAFRDLSDGGVGLGRPLQIRHAISLALSGRESAALNLVSGLGSPQSAGEALHFAQIANLAGDSAAALRYLSAEGNRPKSAPGGASGDSEDKRIRFATIALKTFLQAKSGTGETRFSEVFELIDEASSESEAHRAFLLLESALPDHELPSWNHWTGRWTDQPAHPASRPARFFALLSLSDEDERRRRLSEWIEQNPDSPTALEASIRLASLVDKSVVTGPDSAVLASFPGGAKRLSFEEASQNYRAGRFREAANAFLTGAAGERGPSKSRERYNAAISFLRENDFDSFLTIFRKLEAEAPDSPFIADLKYVGGLSLASNGDTRSIDFLQPFVSENPDHPAHVEALLALAEIQLNQAPARPQTASEILEGLKTRPLTLEQSERLDYTRVWLEEIQHNQKGLVEAAADFLKNWPGSFYLPEIAMLLARQHYEDNRLETARDLFDRVAQESPDSSFARRAAYFAAKSTPPGPEAIERWQRLAEGDREYSVQARHELALLFLSLDRFPEARNELRSIIDLAPPVSSIQLAAKSDLAFSYYAEALAKDHDPGLLEKSAALFAEITNEAGAPEATRYGAAVRRGRCLEVLGNTSVALEIYDSIVTTETSPTLSPIRETDLVSTEWVFRAGFASIQILSGEKRWKEAIRIADTLSEKDGPRAIEASRLAEQMRLKHWVWE